MDRRKFIAGVSALFASSMLPAEAGDGLHGLVTCESHKIRWVEKDFDFGNIKGLALEMTKPDGSILRHAVKYPAGLQAEDRLAEAKKILLEWLGQELPHPEEG